MSVSGAKRGPHPNSGSDSGPGRSPTAGSVPETRATRALDPTPKLPLRRGPAEFNLGTEADHEAVYQNLLHVFHGPDRDSFLGALSDPSYRPEQRLLAKVEGRIASHVHLTERTMRYGTSVTVPINGLMWVGTLPEYRGLGFAQNLIRLADGRARETGVAVQCLTTGMPQFYKPLGWGICGRQTQAHALSRNLPATGDGVVEAKGGIWHVRPWRQVEINDLMRLYDLQFAGVTGSILRSEDYWRWVIGRRYAHVIWVACQGETVRGYAFVKDHRILEIAADPAYPQALRVLLGRVRAEALERAYPKVVVHAPIGHPVIEAFRQASGQVIDQDEYEGTCLMAHLPDPEKVLNAILPELKARADAAGSTLPMDLGVTVDDHRWLIHLDQPKSRVEPDKLSRRHLTLSSAAFVRLVMGHTGIDRALAEDGAEASTTTAIDAARILFPTGPFWRSPLDSATA